MKKIMFNDRFLLTSKVLSGRKTTTRRIITLGFLSKVMKKIGWRKNVKFDIIEEQVFNSSPYKMDEVVAIAQSYESAYYYYRSIGSYKAQIVKEYEGTRGWKNKMYVKSELMPHHIKITDVWIDPLKSINSCECTLEGISRVVNFDEKGKRKMFYYYDDVKTKEVLNGLSKNPKETFSKMMNKLCGYDVWNKNPYVFIYCFKLID
jgi:hypothetical protein